MLIDNFKEFICDKTSVKLLVYNNGIIINTFTNQILKQYSDKNGYKFITVRFNNKRKNHRVHRLLMICFIPNPENKPEVNHKDLDKTNNLLSNLEWCTKSENMIHCVDNTENHKSKSIGEEHSACKFSFDTIKSIRSDYKLGIYSMRKLAKIYNCSIANMSYILNNKTRTLA